MTNLTKTFLSGTLFLGLGHLATNPAQAHDDLTTSNIRPICELVRTKNNASVKVQHAIDAHLEAGRTEINIKKQGDHAMLICGW